MICSRLAHRAGRARASDTPVDLAPVLRQVVDGLQTLAQDRSVEIAVTPPTAPVIVPGNRDELTRVFENLIENALKYGANGNVSRSSSRTRPPPTARRKFS